MGGTGVTRQAPNDDRQRLAAAVHLVTLVGAAAVLFFVNRDHWFVTDEWDMLVQRGILGSARWGVFAPHEGHWVTPVVLAYRLLFTLFGVRTYWPYVALLVVVQLVAAHVMWRLLLRLRVDPLLATAAVAVFAVLGAGAENLTFAYQVSNIGCVAAGLAALLVLPEAGGSQRRDIAAVALLVLSTSLYTLGLVFVAIVALVAWRRRGLRTAVATVAAPVVVYAAWWVAFHDTGPRRGNPHVGLTTAIAELPSTIWRALVAALDGVTGFPGVGAVLVVLLALWVLRSRERSPLVPLAMALGAVVFIAGIRVTQGAVGATALGGLPTPDRDLLSRYVYDVVALALPLLVLALDDLLGRLPPVRRDALLAAGAAVLLVVQVPALERYSRVWTKVEQRLERRVVATADLVRAREPLVGDTLDPVFARYLTVERVAELEGDGALPSGLTLTTRDRLDARLWAQVAVGGRPEVRSTVPPVLVAPRGVARRTTSDCQELRAGASARRVDLLFRAAGAVSIVAPGSTRLPIQLVQGNRTSDSRYVSLRGRSTRWLSVSTAPSIVRLQLAPEASLRVCSL